jgi:hypothetical protein
LVGEGDAISAGGGECGGLGAERGQGGNEGGDRVREYRGAGPDMERGGSGSDVGGSMGVGAGEDPIGMDTTNAFSK